MERYHLRWLEAHPSRSVAWLKDRLAEGFDVHHLDGDHANDDPSNLVLIEHLDHMRLHNAPGDRLGVAKAFSGNGGAKPGARRETLLDGQQAYYARKRGKAWNDIGGRPAMRRAKAYAAYAKAAWPPY